MNILFTFNYSSITTNSLIQLKVKNAQEKKSSIGSSSSESGRKIHKRPEKLRMFNWTVCVLIAIENAAARQLKTADIQPVCLLANSNRNAAARQLETADIRQARLLANRIQSAAAREQNTLES